MAFSLPKRGIVFWPVSNGDSTTIVIDSDTVVQVDLNHLAKSEEGDDPTWSVVHYLAARLPEKNKRPYLAVFALTHPDLDHCRGFEKLLGEVDIGELWFTPRVFLEYKKDLSDDAKVFQKEAQRRVQATIKAGGDPGPGNRVRIFGYSPLLEEDEYKGFPEQRLIIPGNPLTVVDEVDVKSKFRAFVHSPFKDDSDGERNETSLGMQITLYDGVTALRALLFGDLAYPTLKRIFQVTKNGDDLAWNVLLAPHHCSRKAMYWHEEGEEEEKLRQDLLDKIEAAAQSPNQIVSSSDPVPASNTKGDNPPHARAKSRYEGITVDGFICTMEHPNTDNPEPVVFELESGKVKLPAVAPAKSASAAAKAARGGSAPPAGPVTYG